MAITGVFPGVGLTGGGVTGNIYLSLVPASSGSIGGIKPGVGCTVKPDGTLDVTQGGVVSITTGVGLGSPVSGDSITSSGIIKLLPPSADGTKIGGVRAGQNIRIQVDGEITTEGVIQTNNPYAYNSYIWPATSSPVPSAPGENGQVLTLKDKVTGEIGWTSSGGVNSVAAGPGLAVTTSNGSVTVSLQDVGVSASTVGATGLIPTFNVNSKGQILSFGQANPYSQFQIATVTAPPNLVLDFADNNLFWEWTLQNNTAIQAPLNCTSGQTGSILLRQNPITPYNVTWHTNWKWANSTSYSGNPVAAAVDLIEFTVVSPTFIVITNIVQNIG